MMNLYEKLVACRDDGYILFMEKINPAVSKNSIIGVRTPVLRKIAKQMSKDEMSVFMKELPHTYYEENLIHGFLLERIKDFDECLEATEKFLPQIDNWAVCDTSKPKALLKDRETFLRHIKMWISSGKTYSVRFGIDMLMSYFLDGCFDEEYLKIVSEIRSDEYYVKMMQAWYFATALAKQYDSAIWYFEKRLMPPDVFKMAVRKAKDSYRITPETKTYLDTLS